MKKLAFVLALLAVMVTLVASAATAMAATTADVSVTFKCEYIGIAVSPTTYDFGTIAVGTTPSTSTSYFTENNTSTVATDQTIAVTSGTWGVSGFTHDDTATPGADTVGLKTNVGGTWGVSDIIVKYASPNNIVTNQAATTGFSFGLKLYAPTSASNGDTASNTVRLSATKH